MKEWKPESYWGMAAFFNRTYSIQIGSQTLLAERARGEVSFTADKKNRTAQPRFMTGASLRFNRRRRRKARPGSNSGTRPIPASHRESAARQPR